MKTTATFKNAFISLLFCIPTITIFAQSASTTETYIPFKIQLDLSDVNLSTNLFRWEPTYLQTLANQKAMTNQHVPYLSLNEIKAKEDTFPKAHLPYRLNTPPMTFADALLGLINVATELWCSHYYGRTGSYVPIIIPTREGPTIETRFINCGGKIEPYKL